MRASTMRKLSAVFSVCTAILLVGTLVLPYVKSPQTVEHSASPWTGPPGSYQLYGYGIPPVDKGSSISVVISGYTPEELEYSLTPTMGNLLLPALASGGAGNGSTLSLTVKAQDAYSLELMIIAYNGSGFRVSYSGVWSPFNDLPVYTSPAVFLLAASLVGVYYFGTLIPRQLAEEKVEEELKAARK